MALHPRRSLAVATDRLIAVMDHRIRLTGAAHRHARRAPAEQGVVKRHGPVDVLYQQFKPHKFAGQMWGVQGLLLVKAAVILSARTVDRLIYRPSRRAAPCTPARTGGNGCSGAE